MIVLTGSTSGAKLRAAWGDRTNMGVMLAPSAWRNPWCTYAGDNDVYANRNRPDWWENRGLRKWIRMLEKLDKRTIDPLFVLLPDVVADWNATIRHAEIYRPTLLARSLPCGLALQDGCSLAEAAAFKPDYIFIGGTTQWKWTNAEHISDYFHTRGIPVHVGRASGPRRIRECLRIGADSCDGTGWTRHADKMLPKLWAALDGQYEASTQQTLSI